MVHHEGIPVATMKTVNRPASRTPEEIMQMRALEAAQIAEFKLGKEAIARGEVSSIEEFYAKQDAAKVVAAAPQESSGPVSYEEWKKRRSADGGATNRGDAMEVVSPIPMHVNEGTLREQPAKANRDFAMEVPSPIGPEAGEPVNEQSAEEKERAEKLEYARLYRENAMRARERNIVNQTTIAEERAKLLQLPPPPKPIGITFRTVERAPDPLPKVDSQRVYETDYGPRMILSVDESTRPATMYFATPEERRKVDAALVRDEGQSSMGAADFRNVVALSPDQARKFLNKPVETAVRDMAVEAPSPVLQDSRQPQRRYGQAAA